MFERFTDRARRVIVRSQEEARRLNCHYIGTGHILLGLVHEGEGVGARALESLGISLEAVRERAEAVVGQGKYTLDGHIPFAAGGQKALELSLREALQMNHVYIGTEHILLGLIRVDEGKAAQVLIGLGAEPGGVRAAVRRLLYPEDRSQPSLRDVLEAERAGLLTSATVIERRLTEVEEVLKYLCPECEQVMRPAAEALVCGGCGYVQAP